MAIQIPNRQLFIDGEWREPALKKRIPIINPATEETIGLYIDVHFYWFIEILICGFVFQVGLLFLN